MGGAGGGGGGAAVGLRPKARQPGQKKQICLKNKCMVRTRGSITQGHASCGSVVGLCFRVLVAILDSSSSAGSTVGSLVCRRAGASSRMLASVMVAFGARGCGLS